MRFALDTIGVRQIDRDLVGMSGRVSNMTHAMEEVSKLLYRVEKKQFDSEGGYASGGWKPLAESTLAAKRAANLDLRILRATGELIKSVTGDTGTNVSIPKADGLVFGTTIPYATYHQSGRGVPKRPVVELKETDRVEIIKIIQRYIVEEDRV